MDLNFQYPNQPEPVQEENQGLYQYNPWIDIVDSFYNFVTNIQNCQKINFYRQRCWANTFMIWIANDLYWLDIGPRWVPAMTHPLWLIFYSAEVELTDENGEDPKSNEEKSNEGEIEEVIKNVLNTNLSKLMENFQTQLKETTQNVKKTLTEINPPSSPAKKPKTPKDSKK